MGENINSKNTWGVVSLNKIMKYLVVSVILIFAMSSASAVYEDLNAWDANGVKHSNSGEDFNVMLF